jgi:hypothetical protein
MECINPLTIAMYERGYRVVNEMLSSFHLGKQYSQDTKPFDDFLQFQRRFMYDYNLQENVHQYLLIRVKRHLLEKISYLNYTRLDKSIYN